MQQRPVHKVVPCRQPLALAQFNRAPDGPRRSDRRPEDQPQGGGEGEVWLFPKDFAYACNWTLWCLRGPHALWAAMCAATGMYLQAHTVCSFISIWPSTGHLTPCGCQFANLTPTASFLHSTVCTNHLYTGGMCNRAQASHTGGSCRCGSGYREDRKRSFA